MVTPVSDLEGRVGGVCQFGRVNLRGQPTAERTPGVLLQSYIITGDECWIVIMEIDLREVSRGKCELSSFIITITYKLIND